MMNIGKMVIALFLAGSLLCGYTMPLVVAEEEAVRGGELVIGVQTDPKTLFAPMTATGFDLAVCGNMFNALIRHDETGAAMPELAESWETSSDGMTLIFHLVHNATWHDGVKFTSADVKFSLEAIGMVYQGLSASLKPNLESIETPDDYTVIISTTKPIADLMDVYIGLGGPRGYIAPKHLYEGTNITSNPYNWQPVGTGPFKFKEYVAGDHLTMERYDNYWKSGLPYLDRVVFKIIPDAASRALAFAAGEVDFLAHGALSAALRDTLIKAVPNATIGYFSDPMGSTLRAEINMMKEPFSNLKVRQAICAAIDKQAINELVFLGGCNPGISIGTSPRSNPSCAWYFNNDTLIPEYNQTEAERLLDEAGYPRGTDNIRFNMRLTPQLSYSGNNKVAAMVKDDLKEVGIEATIENYDDAAFHEKVFKNWDYDMCFIGAATSPPDMLKLHLDSKNILHVSWSNCMGYNNSEFDRLIELQSVTINKTERGSMIREAIGIAVQDLPCFVIVEQGSLIAHAPGLTAPDYNKNGAWIMMGRMQPIDDLGWAEQDVPESGGSPVPIWVWGTIAAIAIIVVAITGVVIMKRKRK
jgi:peptide/nickel transport system substrate-binding protein